MSTGPLTWKDALRPYEQPQTRRGVAQIATSLLPYLALAAASYLTLGTSTVLTVAFVVLAAGFLVRTFVVFHDCCHGSLLPSRKANARVGTVLGLFVLTPFVRWRHEHQGAPCHLGRPRSPRRRRRFHVDGQRVPGTASGRAASAYRMFRNPIVMFGIGPIFAMIIGPRIVVKDARPRMRGERARHRCGPRGRLRPDVLAARLA